MMWASLRVETLHPQPHLYCAVPLSYDDGQPEVPWRKCVADVGSACIGGGVQRETGDGGAVEEEHISTS